MKNPCKPLKIQNNHSNTRLDTPMAMKKPKDQVTPRIKLHEIVVIALFINFFDIFFSSFIDWRLKMDLMTGKMMKMFSKTITAIGVTVVYKNFSPANIQLKL